MAKYPYQEICKFCTSPFLVKGASYGKTFCSPQCSTKSRQKHFAENECRSCQTALKKGQFRFCSQSCSASYSNTRRQHSLDTKMRIRNSVVKTNGYNPKNDYQPDLPSCAICGALCKRRSAKYCSQTCAVNRPKLVSKKLQQSQNCSTCHHCNQEFLTMRRRKYCDNCRDRYSHNGRAVFWFTFNVFDYPSLFDLNSLKKIGFRSKKNPNGYTRDHKVSVNESIRKNYDPYYITHVMNCELMLFSENAKKHTASSIKYEDLVRLVDDYDKKLL
jgi:hypothetical protein